MGILLGNDKKCVLKVNPNQLFSILGVLCGLVIGQVYKIVANNMEMRWCNHNSEGTEPTTFFAQQWSIMSFDLN